MLEFMVFSLLEVFPHYHQYLDTTWEVKFMKGPFIGTIYSKKLQWDVSGRDFNSEEYDARTKPPTIRLGAARIGIER